MKCNSYWIISQYKNDIKMPQGLLNWKFATSEVFASAENCLDFSVFVVVW